jgi:hypothetical protein
MRQDIAARPVPRDEWMMRVFDNVCSRRKRAYRSEIEMTERKDTKPPPR